MSNQRKRLSVGAQFTIGVAVLFVFWLILLFFSWTSSRWTPQPGEMGVVRSGPSKILVTQWFNGHGIRGTVAPGAGSQFIGFGSTVHAYPSDSSQRTYTITSDASRGDRPGVDVVNVQTSDGKLVGIQGTFFFNTNFNGSPAGVASIERFDNQFGVRTFPIVGSGNGGPQQLTHAYDGNVGFLAFLDANVRPIIDNDLRRSISNVTCAQLVASCALVANGAPSKKVKIGANAGQTNSQTIQGIQDQINTSLADDIKQTLGVDYFAQGQQNRGVRFLLAKVTLPTKIQDEIDNAQAAYAAVNTSAAKVQQAHQDFLANVERQKGYRACQACATQDILKSFHGQTFAPGAGFSITSK